MLEGYVLPKYSKRDPNKHHLGAKEVSATRLGSPGVYILYSYQRQLD